MIEKGKGGSNTQTGLKFERKIDILTLLSRSKGYTIQHGNTILYKGLEVAKSYRKNALYKYLESQGVDYKKILSNRRKPNCSQALV